MTLQIQLKLPSKELRIRIKKWAKSTIEELQHIFNDAKDEGFSEQETYKMIYKELQLQGKSKSTAWRMLKDLPGKGKTRHIGGGKKQPELPILVQDEPKTEEYRKDPEWNKRVSEEIERQRKKYVDKYMPTLEEVPYFPEARIPMRDIVNTAHEVHNAREMIEHPEGDYMVKLDELEKKTKYSGNREIDQYYLRACIAVACGRKSFRGVGSIIC